MLLGAVLALLAFAAILLLVLRQPGTPGDKEVLAAAPATDTAAGNTNSDPSPQAAAVVAAKVTEMPTAEPEQQTTAASPAEAPTAATEASTAGVTPEETQTPTAIAPTSTAVSSPMPTVTLGSPLVTATQPVTNESTAAATADALLGAGATTIANNLDSAAPGNTAGATVAAFPHSQTRGTPYQHSASDSHGIADCDPHAYPCGAPDSGRCNS